MSVMLSGSHQTYEEEDLELSVANNVECFKYFVEMYMRIWFRDEVAWRVPLYRVASCGIGVWQTLPFVIDL